MTKGTLQERITEVNRMILDKEIGDVVVLPVLDVLQMVDFITLFQVQLDQMRENIDSIDQTIERVRMSCNREFRL